MLFILEQGPAIAFSGDLLDEAVQARSTVDWKWKQEFTIIDHAHPCSILLFWTLLVPCTAVFLIYLLSFVCMSLSLSLPFAQAMITAQLRCEERSAVQVELLL